MPTMYVWTDYVPERHRQRLTPGERYLTGDDAALTTIIDDEGGTAWILIPGCAYLDGRAWNVETVADPVPEPSELERLRAGIRAEIDWHEAEVEAFQAYLMNAEYVEDDEMDDIAIEVGWRTTAATRLRALLPQPTPETEGSDGGSQSEGRPAAAPSVS